MIDEKPSANKVITEWAKEKNVPIEFLNIHRIKKNDADESKILSSIITGLVEKGNINCFILIPSPRFLINQLQLNHPKRRRPRKKKRKRKR